jgi:hypothetical protein
MRRSFGLTAAAAAAVMLPSAFVAAAPATNTVSQVVTSVIHRPINAVSIRHDAVTSTNWSGYAVAATNQFTEATGTWVQPAATCNELLGKTYAAFWVGIDGYTSSSVEQLGTDSDCTGRSSPSYYAWWELYPANSVDLSTSQYPVSPGDTLTASVTFASGDYTLTLKSSRGWTFTTTQAGSDANSSAEWIAEAPEICSFFCTNAKLSDFGTMKFSSSEAATGGSLEPISSFTASGGPHEITMATSTGTTRAAPSALATGGEGFSDTWAHN